MIVFCRAQVPACQFDPLDRRTVGSMAKGADVTCHNRIPVSDALTEHFIKFDGCLDAHLLLNAAPVNFDGSGAGPKFRRDLFA